MTGGCDRRVLPALLGGRLWSLKVVKLSSLLRLRAFGQDAESGSGKGSDLSLIQHQCLNNPANQIHQKILVNFYHDLQATKWLTGNDKEHRSHVCALLTPLPPLVLEEDQPRNPAGGQIRYVPLCLDEPWDPVLIGCLW